MVNTEDLIKRLEKLLDYYALSASAFADKIGVQRSSMSHLLSGRNKPSLDFILKIIEAFPEVDLYWILNGNGNIVKDTNQETPTSTLNSTDNGLNNAVSEKNKIDADLPVKLRNALAGQEDTVEKILVFYANGTFKEYLPNKKGIKKGKPRFKKNQGFPNQ